MGNGLLVIKATVGEEIAIGDDITIVVTRKSEPRGKLRLGITAPKHLRIFRIETNQASHQKPIESGAGGGMRTAGPTAEPADKPSSAPRLHTNTEVHHGHTA